MENYQFTIPTLVCGGIGRSGEIGHLLKGRTEKLLLVYGGGSIKRTGLYQKITGSLEENGIRWEELSGIRSNPTLEKVKEGIAICRRGKIQYLLAVGGGSVIDTAKGISIGVDYEGDVWDFFADRKKEVERAIPLAAIPTIPGSGSEASANCVLSNEETREKIGRYSPKFRPQIAVLDPELCLTIPQSLTGPGIYDMFSHTLERYMTPTLHTDVDNEISEGVMRAILRNGLAVAKDPQDLNAWNELMLASDVSHNWMTGIGRIQDWSCHNLEEPVSGYYSRLAHGAGLSIITPAWMRMVYRKHLPMFVQFAVNVMGVRGELRDPERIALEGIEALENFSRKLGLPLHFSEVGIDGEPFEALADQIIASRESGTVGALEKLGREQVLEIYRAAL